MSETYLSQEAYDRLKAEFEDLTTNGRREIAKTIETARAHGDLRENAEYHAAKEDQGRMEARIRQLEHLLETAVIGTPTNVDAVQPGLVVTLDVEGDVETWYVGSREDSVGDHDILSADSPMGSAIMGARVGEERKFETPTGAQLGVKVVEIAIP
ncbi:MAG: transcription elongation factor GreA [Nitriliruptorales bacterium]|nr:transcription elongation factor GreA [Nitriliruptorales bacterium]